MTSTLRPVATTPGDAELDAEKNALGLAITTDKLTLGPEKLALGDRFAASAMTWARLTAWSPSMGIAGADPARLNKLVQAGSGISGATGFDRLKGALAWQADDRTFSLTGSNGRVVWESCTEC